MHPKNEPDPDMAVDEWIERKHEVSVQRCGSCRAEALVWNWLPDGSIAVTCSRCGTVGVRRR